MVGLTKGEKMAEVKIEVVDNYGHSWVVNVFVEQDPLENDEAYAACEQAALEAANVSWNVVE